MKYESKRRRHEKFIIGTWLIKLHIKIIVYQNCLPFESDKLDYAINLRSSFISSFFNY